MPRPSSDVADALAALAEVLAALGVRWYVFGAQAAISYGSARATKDVDVTIELGGVAPAALLGALAGSGFSSRATDAAELAAIAHVVPVAHDRTGVPIDLVIAGPGLEAEFVERAVQRTIAGVEVPVASAEDLVAMKLLAARPHDRDDVIAVLRAQRDRIDVARIRGTLALLEDALGQSDLVPALEDALARARKP